MASNLMHGTMEHTKQQKGTDFFCLENLLAALFLAVGELLLVRFCTCEKSICACCSCANDFSAAFLHRSWPKTTRGGVSML